MHTFAWCLGVVLRSMSAICICQRPPTDFSMLVPARCHHGVYDQRKALVSIAYMHTYEPCGSRVGERSQFEVVPGIAPIVLRRMRHCLASSPLYFRLLCFLLWTCSRVFGWHCIGLADSPHVMAVVDALSRRCAQDAFCSSCAVLRAGICSEHVMSCGEGPDLSFGGTCWWCERDGRPSRPPWRSARRRARSCLWSTRSARLSWEAPHRFGRARMSPLAGLRSSIDSGIMSS